MSFQAVIDRYVLYCQAGALPYLYEYYKQNAALAEEFDLPRSVAPEGRPPADSTV